LAHSRSAIYRAGYGRPMLIFLGEVYEQRQAILRGIRGWLRAQARAALLREHRKAKLV